MKKKIKSGLDSLIDNDFHEIKGARIGLLANQASCDADLRHIVEIFISNDKFELVRIFAPEHGLRGEAQDMVDVENTYDYRSGKEVISLYGNSFQSLSPTVESIQDLDMLVVDLQDVGSRYYTFAQSLILCMNVCGKNDVKVVVLDRPNPIDGVTIEGAPLTKECHSFCGMLPIANRHGLTIGEIAKIAQSGFGEGEDKTDEIDCELTVVKMKGWKREMDFSKTGLHWIAPSPNMPSPDTALVYPGACLFETTNISEGRGTTHPFEYLGAPFIDGYAWAIETMKSKLDLEGAILRPMSFTPQFQKWSQKSCSGIQIHVTDNKTFKPFRYGLALIAAAAKLYPEDFLWRQEAYEFVDSVPPVDLLYGSFHFRKSVDTKTSLETLVPKIKRFETWYKEARKEFLLY
jgi:uncharacterized protein YbbC (DUF1343 family)